ncbi:hypothetical protein UE233_03815 [Acinetobacter oleivorans]|nr:hypothetical protein [Acinetobacter oleivorans]MDY7371763.1 hypothetical protein [Acinetobacter oleivorans]
MKIAHLILCTPLTLVSWCVSANDSSERILEDPPDMTVARKHVALLAAPIRKFHHKYAANAIFK